MDAVSREGQRVKALALKLLLNDARGVVPFNAAVKFITAEKQRHVKRAIANFEMVVFNRAI